MVEVPESSAVGSFTLCGVREPTSLPEPKDSDETSNELPVEGRVGFSTDVPLPFRKGATPPPDLSERKGNLKGEVGYVPKKLPARWSPLEWEKLETFRELTKELFEDMVVLKVDMNLVESVVEEGEMIDDIFYALTEPRSVGTGWRYSRLLKKYLAVFEFHGGLEGANPEPFGVPFLQRYIRQLIADEVSRHIPQSFLYAIEHFSAVFGFESPGSKHPRIRKLATDYAAEAPRRTPAPYFEVNLLDYLEGVVLNRDKDLQTRVACGKLRLCIQASIGHSDLTGTAMRAIEWRRPVGREEVLGRSSRREVRAAAWVAVNPDKDSWLFVLVDLLIKMHGPGWKKHGFVGCASDKIGGFRFAPPLVTEDSLVVRKCLMDDWKEGVRTPLDEAAIKELQWNSCKTTLPTYMTHFKIAPRMVRRQSARKKLPQAMPVHCLREAQTLAINAQWQVLDQVRRGVTVQSLTGDNLDFKPMKPDWSTVTDLVLAGKVPKNISGDAYVEAMRKAVICTTDPDSFDPRVQMQRAPVSLDLRAELRGEGEEDKNGLQKAIQSETESIPLIQGADSELGSPSSSLGDSAESSPDPEAHDIEFYTTYIQLASGQGEVHKPGAGENEEFPWCNASGHRFVSFVLDEDWGMDYSLCERCFGEPEGCPLLCDYKKEEKGYMIRCSRRCRPSCVHDHKHPSDPGFVLRAKEHRCTFHSLVNGDVSP